MPVVRRFLKGKADVRSLNHHSYGATHRRLTAGLHVLCQSLPIPLIPDGPLIAIPDALWLRLHGKRITVYIVLLRSRDRDQAVKAVVHARQGGEGYDGWKRALLRLPDHVRHRIVGATTDGHEGLRRALQECCGTQAPWQSLPLQRCQFHCLAELQRKIGKKRIRRNQYASFVWHGARNWLAHKGRFGPHAGSMGFIGWISRQKDCPTPVRQAAAWFCRVGPQAGVTYDEARLRLPSTTGSAEASCKRLRHLLTRLRPTSMKRLHEICTLFQKIHPSVTCTTAFTTLWLSFEVSLIRRNTWDSIHIVLDDPHYSRTRA